MEDIGNCDELSEILVQSGDELPCSSCTAKTLSVLVHLRIESKVMLIPLSENS